MTTFTQHMQTLWLFISGMCEYVRTFASRWWHEGPIVVVRFDVVSGVRYREACRQALLQEESYQTDLQHDLAGIMSQLRSTDTRINLRKMN